MGSDGTSCSVSGEKHWLWVWQNRDYCYIAADQSRGKACVDKHFADGFAGATLVSDRWPSHLNTRAKAHQICLAHLIRNLNYLEALEKQAFSIQLRELFQEAIKIKKAQGVFSSGHPTSELLEQRLNVLLQETIDKKLYPQTARLQKSLVKLREAVFAFLYEEKLSADNNASEREIRNVKVKMKVSGLFRSGQEVYACLKSIAQTLNKRKANIFEGFSQLAMLENHTLKYIPE